MCGIFAYIGDKEAASLLVTALKRLEYRGYDSAGIGIHGGPGVPLKVRKKVGKVSNLEAEVAHAGNQVSGTLGIAHTRWATHGKPSDINSHPHTTAESSIAVVHNGVIENYAALKEQLSSKGYKFVSQTDTELLAHLVQDLKKQMSEATYTEAELVVVATALRLCEGAYGVAFIFEDRGRSGMYNHRVRVIVFAISNEYLCCSVLSMSLKPEFTVETGSPTASTFEDGDTPRVSDSGDSGSGEGTSQAESEGERAAKAKYLFRLGIAGRAAPPDAVPRDAVYQSREDRPKQHCTLIIFDWDDTLLCTSAIQSTRPPGQKDLLALEAEGIKLLELAKTLGTVIIITNAIEGWVQHSADKYLPTLAKHLKDVEIVSARARFEDTFPDDPTQWKVEAFCQVKENSQTIANLVALGDSTAEMEALHAMAKLYHISYTKTIKFKGKPRCVELQQEISLVQQKLANIVVAVRNYDIRLQQKQSGMENTCLLVMLLPSSSIPRLEQIEKGGFKHFMLKEIMAGDCLVAFNYRRSFDTGPEISKDQPNAMRNALRGRIYQPVDLAARFLQDNFQCPWPSSKSKISKQDTPDKWEIKLGGLEKAARVESALAVLLLASFVRILFTGKDGKGQQIDLCRLRNFLALLAHCEVRIEPTSAHHGKSITISISHQLCDHPAAHCKAFEKLAGVAAEVEYAHGSEIVGAIFAT
ncbi:glmS [Symbiodinium natans]|uniref:glutamine--fructose-6-phosphate transaminase (isomerizing) n=1 Tax=Symbiodinium natans TaxID=878477 RepID=A0A812N910_9DINO|nr:glmS [Symbiodinium natans]